jgi:serine/threonine-protein kinase HipA
MSEQVHVVLDDHSLAPAETVVGTLFRDRKHGEVISFAYDRAYLTAPYAIELDPELPLHAGRMYREPLFGVLRDSSPDRWGRVLMERREAIRREAGRSQARPALGVGLPRWGRRRDPAWRVAPT